MSWVAGVDGCRFGWFAVFHDDSNDKFCWDVVPAIQDIVSHDLAPSIVAVDVPIGLLEAAKRGGRDCDIEARKLLGQPRGSSVFPTPVRSAICSDRYEDAKAVNRSSSDANIGISKQCFSIIPKIREVDQIMTLELQKKVKEVHPELCFWKMVGNVPMAYSKKKADGFRERVALLKEHGMESVLDALGQYRRAIVQRDDVLDAAAACWTARRIKKGEADRIPSAIEYDTERLTMEMWI